MRPAMLLLVCVLFSRDIQGAGAPAPWPVSDLRHGGRAAEPMPQKPTPAVLRAAEIRMVEVPEQEGFQVSATYEILNPQDGALALALVLPEEGCPKEHRACTPMAGMFQDLGARLGDEIIEAARAPREAVSPWANPAGEGHIYRITLPPRQARTLAIEYRIDRSRGAQHFGIEVLSSAGRWGGPVGRVRHVIELAQPVPYVLHPRGHRLERFVELARERGPGARVQLTFVAEEVAARRDFRLVLPDDGIAGQSHLGFCEGFRGDRSDAELLPHLTRYERAHLRACRDLVYALHGRPFTDPALRARHYGAPPPAPAWAQQAGLVLVQRPENRAFKESLLSPGEQAYLRMIASLEKRAGR